MKKSNVGDSQSRGRVRNCLRQRSDRLGAVAVEYVLLITVVGIGALVGLATVRDALVNELDDLANAIMAIT